MEIQNELNKLEHEDYIPSPETSLSYVILETELGVSYMCYISWLLLSVDYKKHVLKAVSDIFAMLENLNHTMIHCDIKPHNVILVKRNGKFVPVCIDFNVSHFTQNETGELTEMQKFLFTPEYKPPEGALIRNGNLEYKTDKIDVYSAGVMAYEMLNGFWFSRHMKEQWQKVQMPYYYDKLELTNEKRSQLEKLIRSCLENVSRKRPDARTVADKYAMLARTDEELYQDVIPWQEEDEGERLKRYVRGIWDAVRKVSPAFRSLTDGSQFSAGEQTWLYPDKEEFLRLAVQQMDRDFIVTDAHSAIGVYSPKEGKKKNRLIMQYLFLLDREDAEQKLRETSAEINASVQLRESCFNIVEIYPEYSTPLNLIQKAINGEKGSLPFVLKGMELGLVYTNYMKWLFSNQNHYREYVLEAVKDVLGVVKSLHDAGAVHGNICSDNIMLVRRGNRNVLVLTNFRNSIRYEPKSVREDIYQMGLLIYELLDGKCYPDKTKIPVGKKTSFVSSKANLWQRINLVRNPLDELLAMCLDREKYPDADEDALSQKLREAVK